MAFPDSTSVDTDIALENVFTGGVITGVLVKVSVNDADGLTGDIRGVFFQAARTVDRSQISVTGTHVRAYSVSEGNVQALASKDVTMSGDGSKHKYDVGVEIGTQGIGVDDIRHTEFLVFGVTLDDFESGQEFGIRLTSVGTVNDRGQSSKLYGKSFCCTA